MRQTWTIFAAWAKIVQSKDRNLFMIREEIMEVTITIQNYYNLLTNKSLQDLAKGGTDIAHSYFA